MTKIADIEKAIEAGLHPELKPDGTVEVHDAPPRTPIPRPSVAELEAILAPRIVSVTLHYDSAEDSTCAPSEALVKLQDEAKQR